MRVVLVGSDRERARLRAELNGSMEVVGEFPTIAAAREADMESDAMLLAPSARRPGPFGPGIREFVLLGLAAVPLWR